eukprot:TRINITY_DN12840_c0_g2_i1.p1 TRINITY_DN12840_c0_g2~~TRINITY_DN12840_c0_g2_i1.p1  ORF type:complete len:745 (+),score=156.10 TRINITY_DN12840_c0_g2_i1:66-2300(+)
MDPAARIIIVSGTPQRSLCDGPYRLVPCKLVGGLPVWRQLRRARWLYSAPDGCWRISDSEADFAKGLGWAGSATPHGGALPHEVGSWELGRGRGHDPQIVVRAAGGAGSAARLSPSDVRPAAARALLGPPRPPRPGAVRGGELLGEGRFAAVRRSTLPGHASVALKVLRWTAEAEAVLLKEVAIHSRLRHPNVVGLLGAWLQHTGGAEGEPPELHLAMELCPGGTLRDAAQGCPQKCLSEPEARIAFRHIAAALAYMHRRHVAHHDLKSENVLRSHCGAWQLCDLGLACVADGSASCADCDGTPSYLAPEALRASRLRVVRSLLGGEPAEPYDAARADLWALGVVLVEVAGGARPFDGGSAQGVFSRVLFEAPQYPAALPKGPRSAAEALLRKEPGRRATLAEVTGQDWVLGGELPRDWLQQHLQGVFAEAEASQLELGDAAAEESAERARQEAAQTKARQQLAGAARRAAQQLLAHRTAEGAQRAAVAQQEAGARRALAGDVGRDAEAARRAVQGRLRRALAARCLQRAERERQARRAVGAARAAPGPASCGVCRKGSVCSGGTALEGGSAASPVPSPVPAPLSPPPAPGGGESRRRPSAASSAAAGSAPLSPPPGLLPRRLSAASSTAAGAPAAAAAGPPAAGAVRFADPVSRRTVVLAAGDSRGVLSCTGGSSGEAGAEAATVAARSIIIAPCPCGGRRLTLLLQAADGSWRSAAAAPADADAAAALCAAWGVPCSRPAAL